jgi:hypothetical protein
MARVLFRVTYTVSDSKRKEYLATVASLRTHYASTDTLYAVFEDTHRRGAFEEVYIYPSMDAYEASDDPKSLGEAASALIERLSTITENVRYIAAKEVA